MDFKSLLLKWLEGSNPAIKGLDLKLQGAGIIFCKNERGLLPGLTIFEPKDFTNDLLRRFKVRLSKSTGENLKYEMILPPVLQQKASLALKVADIHDLKVSYSPFLHLKELGGSFSVRSRIRVVNVDDSKVILKFLRHVLEDLHYVDVVGQTDQPMEAIEKIKNWIPDVVTMDIQMPRKTGVELLKDLRAVSSVPVIMISSLSLSEGSQVFEALNSGAFDYIQKPQLQDKSEFMEQLDLRLAEAACSKNLKSGGVRASTESGPALEFPKDLIWCLGSSTGGTQALTSVFTSLPNKIPPTLVVQHIPPVFSKAFADSLSQLCPFKVTEAVDGEVLEANHVYIAPGGFQMGLERRGDKIVLRIQDLPPVNRFKPSVDFLFHRVAALGGVKVVAGVLTGMGRDGAEGLAELFKGGASTFAQDEASSAVYGMPRAAFEIGATKNVLALDHIARFLLFQSSSAELKNLPRAS